MAPKQEASGSAVLATLIELRGGVTLNELDEAMTELVQAVRETGKKGKVTLTLEVRPASKGKTQALILEDQIKVSRPELERGATVFFADDANRLSRNDPRQMSLSEIKEVPGIEPAEPEGRPTLRGVS